MPGYEVGDEHGSPRIDFRGALPHEAVREVLAEHDVLLFPSYHKGEGMPGVLIEALQMGLPVICSDWRGLPEIIRHEENGLRVVPRSVAQLSAAMRRIHEDEALFQELVRGALRSGELYRRPEWSRMFGDWLVELGSARLGLAPPAASEPTARKVA